MRWVILLAVLLACSTICWAASNSKPTSLGKNKNYPDRDEVDECGPIKIQIRRNTGPFRRLIRYITSLQVTASSNDSYVSARLKLVLDRLILVISSSDVIDIIQGWSEDIDLNDRLNLRYEARSIRFRYKNNNSNSRLRRLAGYAIEAGCDWVRNQDDDYIICSVRPDDCRVPIDLTFMLDTSGSVGKKNHKIALQFIADVVSYFNIGSNATQVALIPFATYVHSYILFNGFTDKGALIEDILATHYSGGWTRTWKALYVTDEYVYKTEYGARPLSSGIPRVAIILTDGKSNGYDAVPYADDLKASGVTIFSVGIGKGIDEDELNEFASEPIDDHVIFIDSYTDIEDFVNRLSAYTCTEPGPVDPGNNTEVELPEDDFRYFQAMCTAYLENSTSITIEETDVNGSCSLYVSTDPDNNNPGPLTNNITTFINASNTVIKHITLPSGINTTLVYISLRGTGNSTNICTVTIYDALFNSTTFSLSLPEDDYDNRVLGTLQAVNRSGGFDYEYSVIEESDYTFFSIDPETGLLTVTGSFDAEGKSTYTTSVLVQDPRVACLRGRTRVTLTITDINDNAPVFTQPVYSISIPETTSLNSPVITISASDLDSGLNAQLVFSFGTSPTPDTDFSISADGVVTVTGSLDGFFTAQYAYTVVATDSGQPAMSATAELTIIVTTVNQQPEFTGCSTSSCDLYLPENTAVGELEYFLFATDPDTGGLDATLSWSGGSSPFEINSSTGELSLTSSLDRETTSSYTLTFVVSDGGDPSLSAIGGVTVTVTDINDNPPVFEQLSYSAEITENQGPTELFRVVATDMDVGENADVTYSLSGVGAQYFSINTEGYVSTIQAFDFENIPSNPLEFSIIATDGIFEDEALGSLSILDLNDNSPDIIGDVTAILSEDVPTGTLVFNLTITDADSGINGEVTVAIVDGNQEEIFTLEYADSQAIIRIGDAGLDFEMSRTHSLNLRATDGGNPVRISSQDLVLTVLDVNDNTPVCSSDTTNTLREDVPVGTRVGQVLATDGDMLGSLNSQITYTITAVNNSQTDLGLFHIDSDGVVTTYELLDIEVSPQYTITVTASDNGNPPLSCTASIVLTLEDVNEFPPVINTTAQTLNFSVREDTPVNTVIATVVATDADLTSAAIIYELTSPDFSINSETGEISVSRSLDYETTQSYQLVVVATNGEDEQTAIIDVQVININDITPMIDITSPVIVPENVVIDGIVCVPIIDGDGDANGIFTLTFSGAVSSFLSFDTTSFCFNVTTQFDREGVLGDSFTVIVTVNDNGEPNLHSTSEFMIQISDVNDNSPTFSADVFTANVSENTATGTPVRSVIATDIDAGMNREINYTTNSTQFAIDNEGLITVNGVLDYESTDRIVLLVTATDRGIPSLEGTTIVIITITDVNDNSPIITNLPDTVSLQENGVSQMLIFEVMSFDLDTDPDSLSPIYSILSITPSNTPSFIINHSSGVITADATQFDREAIPSYSLTISVSDGSNSDTGILTVHVTDENDNAPVLLGDLSISVRECEQDCDAILTIQTSDNDIAGTANAQLGAVRVFDTSSFTADILSTNSINISCNLGTLDFETATTGSFILQVTDAGTPPLSTNRTIQVQVLDCNDNSPVFSPTTIQIQLPEDTLVGTVVTTFNATDPDTGVAGEITFRQTEPNESFFTINADTGAVTLIRALDFEDMTNHTFYVLASDNGSPSLSTESFLQVTVTNVNDNLPVFNADTYTISLLEDTDIGYVYSEIMATDEDGDDIIFYLTGDSPFQILNEKSADLTLVDQLDFEYRQMYSFTISAKNPSSSVNVTAKVDLYVTDVNDNPPVITNLVVTYNVAEDTQTDAFVFTVTAQDPDSGVNGMFHFFFQNDVTAFNLTSDGVVTTAMPLDREVIGQYMLTITVQDMGNPTMSSSENFTVSITDINDNRPLFSSSQYLDSISEATPINSTLNTVVLVTDADSDANGDVDLTDDSSVFDVMNDGTVRLVQTLDYELRTMYTFTVTATDRGNPSRSNTANYIVTVVNVNDNAPVFSPSQFQQNIQECNQLTDSCECGGVIFTAQATDADNDMLTYSVTGSNLFSINSTSGELTASCDVDREVDDTFVITITASDSLFESNLTLYLTVTDVNDNIPYFQSPNMTVTVREDTQAGDEIASIVVRDGDIGFNGAVQLSIEQTEPSDTDSVLAILQDGTVTLSSGLDFESVQEYEFLITATDSGSPSLTNTTTFTLTVSDVNDNTPVFQFSNYSVSFNENATPQSLICLAATDEDDNLNAQLTLFIVNSSQVLDELESAFSFSGCNLSVEQSFDFELIQFFTIYIGVRDAGTPSLSSSVPLFVQILDVNDNDPVFEGEYPDPLMVSENTPIATIILTLQASDADSELNGDIIFSLSEPDNTFNISSDGDLSTQVLLDFETTETYSLTFVATDMGNEARNSSLNLNIQVVNENDNTPMFNQSSYQFYILENSAISTIIGYTPATDGDVGVFGELSYSVLSASDDVAYYYHTQYSHLVTLIDLDRETTPSYTLEVQVLDGGDPPLFDLADVTITILDVNDNSPLFDNDTIEVTIPENAPTNSLVVELHATDADQPNTPNSLITFSVNDTRFSLETDSTLGTAIIRTNTVLDRETQSLYVIQVIATDSGTPPLSSTAYVTINISDVNDNAPMFNTTSANRTLPEDTAVGTLVATFLATDRDQTSSIQYNIDPSDTFSINSTGSVFLVASLDFETTQFYDLTINATDNINSQTATLLVFVSDVNEFSPSFLQNYTAEIDENSPADSFIIAVAATDEDGTSLLRYSISGERVSEFMIGDSSGNVTALASLDREDSRGSGIVLQLQVTDSGNPALLGFATLSIQVLDVNDNTPEFVNFPDSLTVSEDATELTQIQAIDGDMGENANILFTLDEDFDLFNITPDGLLELIGSLDFETGTSYNLTVIATDGGVNPLSAIATLQIIVTDINDNTPIFQNSAFTADVTEHAATATLVFTAVASDADSGDNAQLRFSLSSNPYLSIDPDSGQVNVTSVIDRETIDTINVTITVCDGGVPMLCANQLLTVTVTDINDQSPQFPQQQVTVYISESTAAATIIHEAVATDNDAPNSVNSQIISYTVSPVSDGFTVNSLGQVSSPELDFEARQSYLLVVTATDGGQPSLSGSYSLTVIVTDVNDNAPVITIDPVELTVPENQTPSLLAVNITATDADSDASGDVTFRLLESNTPFTLTPGGALFLSESLDYDTGVRSYTLTILATDGGSPSLNSTAQLVILVGEVNDNVPTFNQTSYFASVEEGQTPSYFVVTVSASDADFDSQITYSLSNQSFFSINSNGRIDAIVSFDYEYEQFLVFSVTATDNGTPAQSVEVTVFVSITDINDNTPQFLNEDRVNISETVSTPSVVLALSAVDLDSGLFGEVFFTLDTPSQIFSISSEGNTNELVVTQPLDYELVQSYSLMITVHDRGDPELNSTITLVIDVVNENDNAPVFNQSMYSGSVEEDAENGYVVLTVEAIDADLGILGMVEYSISVNLFFSINQQGNILVNNNINADSIFSVQLFVTACDGGTPPRCTNAPVNISLSDVNDNFPQIFSPNDGDIFSIAENSPVGTVVTEIVASDADRVPPNNQLSYTIEVVGNCFAISGNNITVANPIDFEELDTPLFNVTITVSDGGTPSLSDTITIQIQVLDVNDNPPVISGPITASIAENQATYPTRQFSAPDPDSNTGGQFLFSISNTNLVSINQNTGVVTFNGPFDHEDTTEYNFTVTATDQGVPSLSDTTYLVIQVLDINDNRPEFSMQIYQESIPENTPLQSTVLTVVATDSDGTSDNNVITYSILPLNQVNFQINDDGNIFLAVSLDFETLTSQTIEFQVVAADNGNPSLNSTTIVRITVTDSNDNSPQIIPPGALSILEGTSLNTVLTTIQATDADSGSNGEFNFSIISPTSAPFSINSNNGNIIVTDTLDREIQDLYTLTILVQDNGVPSLSSEIVVNVTILDRNDNSPVFQDTPYIFFIPENVNNNTLVDSISVTDADTGVNADITCTLSGVGSEQFSLSADGAIFTASNLDREIVSSYSLTVTCQDTSSSPLISTTSVDITVTDINDNVPLFPDSQYTFSVREDINPDTLIGTIQASDADEPNSLNSEIEFFITAGNEGSYFRILTDGMLLSNNTSGRIPLAEYNLTVTAADRGTPSLSASTQVLIGIIDVNDVAPTFNTTDVGVVRISEYTPEGENVANFTAVDLEGSVITYSLVTDLGREGDFRVDSATGGIFVNQSLDYERDREYTLILMAVDSPGAGEGAQRTGVVSIPVFILDENDNSPIFDQATYEANITENEIGPLNLVTVSATDLDSLENGLVRYFLSASALSNLFSINSSTGVVSLVSGVTFDFEGSLGNQLVITVRGDDQGTPPNSATTSLTINILDLNDNTPQLPATYNASVQEEQPADTFVTLIQATDLDSDRNGEILYSLDSTEQIPFDINPDTGRVATTAVLDRETRDSYVFVVTATDRGSPARSNSTTVTVTVLDINDNCPNVINENTGISIIEESAGEVLDNNLQVVDPDAGLNGELNYTLSDPEQRMLFSINPQTGLLTLLQRLDRETTDQYNLTVVIADRGTPPCTSTTFVTINVQDQNDNRAVFTGTPYIVSINEGVPLGTPVICVTASDPDLGLNGEFTLRLVGTSPFTLNSSTDCITTSGDIDRETDPQFLLEVRAEERIISLFSSVIVTVNVIDGNDNIPTFLEDPYIFTVTNPTTTTSIGTLTAVDLDENENGQLSYEHSITGSNNTQQSYEFTVTDAGASPLSSSTDVIINFPYCQYLTISTTNTNNDVSIFIQTLCTATVELLSTFTVLNSTITLDCDVVGNLFFMVQWYKNGNPLTDPASTTRLTINSLSVSNEGQYTCQAIRQEVTIQSEPYSLIVQIPPEITIPPKNLAINNGDTLNLTCYSIGVPDPDHTWRLISDEIIDLDSPRTTEFTVTKNQVILPDISEEYEGFYSCNASNVVGYDEASGHIIIHSPSDVVTIGLNTNFSNPDPNNNGCNNLDSTILNDLLSMITGTSATIVTSSGDGNLCDSSGGTTTTTTTTPVTLCNPNPCNGYACSLDLLTGFSCACPGTLNGITCDEDNDECSGSGICQNGGTCTNFFNGFTCTCSAGFTGVTCEVPISCTPTSCNDSEVCMDTVQGFDCLVTQNVTLDTTSNAAANTIAESVNDEEMIIITRRRRQTTTPPEIAYRNCVVFPYIESGSTQLTLIIGCPMEFALAETDYSDLCQYLYDGYANFQACSTPSGNVLHGPKTPPTPSVTLTVVLSDSASGVVIPGSTAVDIINTAISGAGDNDYLNDLREIGFTNPDLNQISATSLPEIPVEYTGLVIGILFALLILVVAITVCFCIAVYVKRSRPGKVTSYEESARIEPRSKPEDLEQANSMRLRDMSVEPESNYGIVEEAVTVTPFNNPNTEEIVEEVQVRKPSLASKFSFKKNVPVHEEKRSLVPADTETAEATNTARATSPTEKPPVGKSDSLPRRILATTASFGKKKEKIDAAPLIDDDTGDVEDTSDQQLLPEKLPEKLPPKKKILEPQSPTGDERELVAGALVPLSERDREYKEDLTDVYSNVNVKPDASMAQLWETAVKDEKQEKKLIAGKKLISVQSQEDLKVEDPALAPAPVPAPAPAPAPAPSPPSTVDVTAPVQEPTLPVEPIPPPQSTEPVSKPAPVEKIEHSLTYPWYHSDLNREQAEVRLMQLGKDGSFLVRAASSAKGDYSLSILVSYKEPLFKHLLIKDIGTELVLQAQQDAKTNFPHLASLVAYYSNVEFEFSDFKKKTKLSHPILK